ncbi:unnamed protein product [Effrenium voratum]|nr:unnamed protein product [Effrenium voratum]
MTMVPCSSFQESTTFARAKRPVAASFVLSRHPAMEGQLRSLRFDFNDAIIRGVLFVPLFTEFLTAMHRDALSPSPSAITKFFGCKVMATLGSIAFPMFIVHGPIGQIFYKKVIARKLWGKPMPHTFFPCYLAICVSISYLTNEYFVKSKKVGAVAGKVAQVLAGWTQGMLRDGGN